MSKPPEFETVGDCAAYRPSGEFSLEQAIQLITGAISRAREQEVKRLLVVTLGLTGFSKPSVIDRYYLIQEWSKAAAMRVRVAVVTQPEMVDPRKFGVTVARNIGFDCDV